MPVVEGVGDEVLLVVGLFLLVCIVLLAWFSTHTRDIPFVSVIVVELSQRRLRSGTGNGDGSFVQAGGGGGGEGAVGQQQAETASAEMDSHIGEAVSTNNNADTANDAGDDSAAAAAASKNSVYEDVMSQSLPDSGRKFADPPLPVPSQVTSEPGDQMDEKAADGPSPETEETVTTIPSFKPQPESGEEMRRRRVAYFHGGGSGQGGSGALKDSNTPLGEEHTPGVVVEEVASKRCAEVTAALSPVSSSESNTNQLTASAEVTMLCQASSSEPNTNQLTTLSDLTTGTPQLSGPMKNPSNINQLTASTDFTTGTPQLSGQTKEKPSVFPSPAGASASSTTQSSKPSSCSPELPRTESDASPSPPRTSSSQGSTCEESPLLGVPPGMGPGETWESTGESPSGVTEAAAEGGEEGASAASGVGVMREGVVRTEPAAEKVEETAADSADQQIRVRLKYMNDTQRLVYADPHETVGNFRRLHFSSELDDNKIVRFIFNGQDLRNDLSTLQAYNIADNSVVHCLITQNQRNEASAASGVARAGGQEEDGQMGALLFPVFGVVLGVVWYMRFTYKQYFNAMSTVSLAGISFIYLLALFSSVRHRRRPHLHLE
ncbi:uncharacterized protein LOC143276371 [Babylonia areolata]|uniref:uncharacterized protein LOC143276371 n=1 Tax=Babylonia areolata TaxID=304850 RepID=UPI003FD61EB8